MANADYVENMGDNRRHYISMPIIFKRTVYTATRVCARIHTEGNRVMSDSEHWYELILTSV